MWCARGNSLIPGTPPMWYARKTIIITCVSLGGALGISWVGSFLFFFLFFIFFSIFVPLVILFIVTKEKDNNKMNMISYQKGWLL
jgi:hypothetical protein